MSEAFLVTGIHEVRWTQMPGTGGTDGDDRWVWRCSCGDWSRDDFDTEAGAACAAGQHLGEQAATLPQAEVDRLRGRLAELEWAGPLQVCPACERWKTGGHDPGCWLAAEIAERER